MSLLHTHAGPGRSGAAREWPYNAIMRHVTEDEADSIFCFWIASNKSHLITVGYDMSYDTVASGKESKFRF